MIYGTVKYQPYTPLLTYWCSILRRQYPAVKHWFNMWFTPAEASWNNPVYLNTFFFSVSMGLKRLGWCHYDIAGLLKKILISMRGTLGSCPIQLVHGRCWMLSPLRATEWCRHSWMDQVAFSSWPRGLPMPLKNKRLPDPSCHAASTVFVYSPLPLPITMSSVCFQVALLCHLPSELRARQPPDDIQQ